MPEKKKRVLDLDLGAKGFYDKGHPYRPGSGPKGQTCGTCSKCVTVFAPVGEILYHACRVTKVRYPMLDVYYPGRVSEDDPACLCWEPSILKEGFNLMPWHMHGTNYQSRR